MNNAYIFRKKPWISNDSLAARFKLFNRCYENYKNNYSSDRCFKHRGLACNVRAFGNGSNWHSATRSGCRAGTAATGGGGGNSP
jgi:hypothetical protein